MFCPEPVYNRECLRDAQQQRKSLENKLGSFGQVPSILLVTWNKLILSYLLSALGSLSSSGMWQLHEKHICSYKWELASLQEKYYTVNAKYFLFLLVRCRYWKLEANNSTEITLTYGYNVYKIRHSIGKLKVFFFFLLLDCPLCWTKSAIAVEASW